MNKPLPSEYPTYYANYVQLVKNLDAISALEEAKVESLRLLQSLPHNKANYRYAPEKWSINDLLQHIIDCEIIFATRALRIARNDKSPQPGFEQDDYVAAAKADYTNLADMITLFEQTRNFSISLFKTFVHAQENTGQVNGGTTSVRALAFITAGHNLHHMQIIRERYL